MRSKSVLSAGLVPAVGMIAVLGLSACSSGGPTAGPRATAPTASSAAADATCVRVDADSGRPFWVGEPSAELSAAAQELQGLVDAHAEALRGVSFCSHYEGVVVFASSDAPAGVLAAVDEAAGRHPLATVSVERHGLAIADLKAAAASLATRLQGEEGIVSIGPDIEAGDIDVGIDESRITAQQARQAVASIVSQTGFPSPQVPIHFFDESGVATNSASALAVSR